jgi:HSP20 family protein
MARKQELSVQQKKEAAAKEEKTVPTRTFVPAADIYETAEALTLVLEMPGVDKGALDVTLEDDVLQIEGRIDFGKYEGLEPVYAEYNVGHYARSFTVGSGIDGGKISAQLNDGVLTLTLPKSEAARPRRIAIG